MLELSELLPHDITLLTHQNDSMPPQPGGGMLVFSAYRKRL